MNRILNGEGKDQDRRGKRRWGDRKDFGSFLLARALALNDHNRFSAGSVYN
jgi:hypothetical protein